MKKNNIRVEQYRVVDNLAPFVQVTYKDKMAHELVGLMMVDTGSVVNVLSCEIAEQLDESCKQKNETKSVFTATGDTIITECATFSFGFGGQQFQEYFCINKKFKLGKVEDLPIVGILGNMFLQTNNLVIDYTDYTFHTADVSLDDLYLDDFDFFFPIELGLKYYTAPVLSFHQDGNDIVSLVDTGSTDNVISETAIEKYGLDCQYTNIASSMTGLIGTREAKEAKVKFNLLSLGENGPIPTYDEEKFIVSPHSISLGIDDDKPEEEKLCPIDVIIGAPFIAKQGWILDFANKMIYKLKSK